jgi:hypothetical protein
MTLADIEELLPNGFHDAEIEKFIWDYRTNSASFTMELWVAEDGDQSPEVYRKGRLDLKEIVFIMIDTPDIKPYKASLGTLRIDGLATTESILPNLAALTETVTPYVNAYSFYVDNWNSYIHIAAKESELIWIGEREVRKK